MRVSGPGSDKTWGRRERRSRGSRDRPAVHVHDGSRQTTSELGCWSQANRRRSAPKRILALEDAEDGRATGGRQAELDWTDRPSWTGHQKKDVCLLMLRLMLSHPAKGQVLKFGMRGKDRDDLTSSYFKQPSPGSSFEIGAVSGEKVACHLGLLPDPPMTSNDPKNK